MGFVFSGMTFGVLVSPFLAGTAYDKAGYSAVLAMMFGVLGIDIVLRLFMIDKKGAMIRNIGCDESIAYGHVVDDASSFDESEGEIQGLRGTSPREGRDDERMTSQATMADENSPLLPSRSESARSSFADFSGKMAVLMRSRRLMAAVFGSLIHIVLLSAFDAILPRYISLLFGWSATAAGAVFFTINGPGVFGALFGALSDRFGCRLVALAGFAIATPSLVLLSLIDKDSLVDQILLCFFLTLIGQ